jgi:hypothetical protein
MPWLYKTGQSGGTYGWTGKFFYAPPVSSASVANDALYIEVSLPTNVIPVDQQTSFAPFNGSGISRMYMCGGWTDNLVFTENFALLQQGIEAPTGELVSGTGTGDQIGVTTAAGPGISGEIIVYLSYWDDEHGRRSPLSNGSPVQTFSNQSVNINNLPTTAPNASVTHWEVWHSVDGALPALAVRRQIGATSITENTPALSLGEVADTSFGKFPRCRYNVIYHDRQVMAGDDRHPDRVYFSEIGRPEQYSNLWLRTRKGEAITALAVVRDTLLVFGATSTYLVQGYTAADLQMQVVEPQIGCINHHGIANVHGMSIIPSHIGFYLTTGTSFHFISQEFDHAWKEEYRENQDAYESRGWGVHDQESRVYKFWVGTGNDLISHVGSGTRNVYWVLDYEPLINEVGGNFQPPRLSFDVRTREDRCGAMMAEPGGRRGDLYVGSCDGKVYKENDEDDDDDAGDTFAKRIHLQTPHYFWGTPGGAPDEGWNYATFWIYCVHNKAAATTSELNLFVGDEGAWEQVVWDSGNLPKRGSYYELIPGGALTYDNYEDGTGGSQGTAEVRRVWFTEPNVDGRGLTMTWSLASPDKSVAWHGFGGTRRPGENFRGVTDISGGG